MACRLHQLASDLHAALEGWRAAKPGSAAERRAARMLAYRSAAPCGLLLADLDCAACNGTIAEIARLSDQLRAHQTAFAHRAVPGRE